MHESAHAGEESDLDGGGLRRSLSGWRHHERLGAGRERWASDERILGAHEFVQQALRETEDAPVSAAHPAPVIQPLIAMVCRHFGVSPGELGSRGFVDGIASALKSRANGRALEAFESFEDSFVLREPAAIYDALSAAEKRHGGRKEDHP